MKALVVEDDENKRAQILGFLHDTIGISEVATAQSYRGGTARVLDESYDIVILDMTMPTYEMELDEEGGRPRVFAGRDILRQLERRGRVVPVIVVTQFDKFGDHNEVKTREELDRELSRAHPVNYRGMVYYDAAQEGWKEELAGLVKAIGDGGATR